MSKQKNSIDLERVNASLGRRGFLKAFSGAGLGLAAAGLTQAAPQLLKKNQIVKRETSRLRSVSAAMVWNDPLQQLYYNIGQGAYSQGMACVYTRNVAGNSSHLQLFDIHSGGTLSNVTYFSQVQPFGNFHMTNGFVVAATLSDDGSKRGFFAVAAGASAISPNSAFLEAPEPISDGVSYGSKFAYVSGDNNLNFLTFSQNPATGLPTYTADAPVPLTGYVRITNASIDVTDPTKFIVTADNSGYSFDLSSGAARLRAQAPLNGMATYVVATDDLWISVGATGGDVSPYNIEAFGWDDTAHRWIYKNGFPICKPVVANGMVLFGGADGYLTALDATTGNYLWHVKANGDLSGSTIFLEDGICYFKDGQGYICAIDITAGGDPVLVTWFYVDDAGPSYPSLLLGVENGVCIVQHPGVKNLSGVDMASQVHQFSASSMLLATDMVGEPGANQPASPAYHTVVSLKDQAGAPRSFISVKISTYDDVTITDGENTYQVTSTQPLWLTTDASGNLDLCVQADDISCPALYLWATFMDREESMIVYPDQGIAGRLATAQASDLGGGKAFDGTNLLNSGTDPAAVAQFLTSTMAAGGVGASMQLARQQQKQRGARFAASRRETKGHVGRARVLAASGDPNTYVSFPDTNANLLYQYPAGAAATRPYQVANITQFYATIDASGRICFNNCSVALEASPHLLGLSWSEFKSKVVHGIQKVTSFAVAVIQATGQLVHTIIDDAKNIYTLAINSLEDAFNSVAGFLKTVVSDIKRFIEYLSYLFNWNDILAMRDTLKGKLCSGMAKASSVITNESQTLYGKIHTFLQGAEKTATDDIDAIIALVGGQSVSNQPKQYLDPKYIFDAYKVLTYNPMMHFFNKFINKEMQKVENKVEDILGIGNVSGSQTTACGSFDLTNLISSIHNAIETCETQLANDAVQLLDSIMQFFQTFQNGAGSVAQFSKMLFTDLLTWLKQLAVIMINATDTIVETILNVIPLFFQGVQWMLMRTINLPLLSSFYKTISHDELSFVDVACLVIAIPASIISKAVGSSVSSGLLGGPSDPLDLIVASACTFIGGIVDAACDAAEDNAPTSAASMLDVLFPCLGMMFNVDNDNWDDGAYIFYFFCQTMAWVIPGAAAFYYARGVTAQSANPKGPTTDEMKESNNFNDMAPWYNCGYGALMLILTGVMAKGDPDTFLGKKNYSLASNICGNIPYLSKPLSLAGPYGKAGLAAIDVAGQGFSVGFNVAESYQ